MREKQLILRNVLESDLRSAKAKEIIAASLGMEPLISRVSSAIPTMLKESLAMCLAFLAIYKWTNFADKALLPCVLQAIRKSIALLGHIYDVNYSGFEYNVPTVMNSLIFITLTLLVHENVQPEYFIAPLIPMYLIYKILPYSLKQCYFGHVVDHNNQNQNNQINEPVQNNLQHEH